MNDDMFGAALWTGLVIGAIVGILLTFSYIDDRPEFTIPFTDKTFVRAIGE